MADSRTAASGTFAGKRVVVTQAGDFMGPAITHAFAEEGATVIADERDLKDAKAAGALIAEAGRVDVLIANLMFRNPRTSIPETTDQLWAAQFDAWSIHFTGSSGCAAADDRTALRQDCRCRERQCLAGTTPRAAHQPPAVRNSHMCVGRS